MDRQRGTAWTEVRGLIHRPPGDFLIVKPVRDPQVAWEFPGGAVPPRMSKEVLLRRLCLERLGIELGVLVSQRPFVHSFGTRAVTYHYFLGPVASDEAVPLGYAELRWVPLVQLGEYVMDAQSQRIVRRLAVADRI